MTLTKLIEILQNYQKEIGGDTSAIPFHQIKSTVNFKLTNPELSYNLELDDSEYPFGIELDLLPGCQCPYGVSFHIKATKD